MIYLELFAVFFKIGLLTIGGGLSSLPLLQEQCLQSGWIGEGEFMDMLAVSQSTPGPIGINMATFTGYKVAAFPGAVVATAGMVAPSLIIIVLIAAFIRDFDRRPLVRHLMSGFRPAAVGLIAAATLLIFTGAVYDLPGLLRGAEPACNPVTLLLFAGLLILHRLRKWHPALFLLIGAAAGAILC